MWQFSLWFKEQFKAPLRFTHIWSFLAPEAPSQGSAAIHFLLSATKHLHKNRLRSCSPLPCSSKAAYDLSLMEKEMQLLQTPQFIESTSAPLSTWLYRLGEAGSGNKKNTRAVEWLLIPLWKECASINLAG